MATPLEALRTALAGQYEVERELGRGGMATVYLARDLKHHRPVAIKVVRPELAESLGAERFLREIDTAAHLTHPHILPLFDSGEAGGALYYVMPYVEGESLRDRLARERQLPLEEALQIASEVADALDYAHSRGVVHRDIKPANILLESGHAVVADFGIARAVSAAGSEAVTETGLTPGTPAYMSPEQAAGSNVLDGRSDLYSLGCVLYEMLAGQPPFTGPTAESLVHQHLTAAPRPVTDVRPAIPGPVAAALLRVLAKAPADRFSTGTQFADALALREPAATPAPIPSAPSRPAPGRWRRRRWALVMLAGAGVAAAVGASLYLRPWRQAVAPPPPAAVHDRAAIAVLPPLNLSADGPHAYFAGGLHDELLTQLSKVASLKVISRTSVMGYQGTTKPLKLIADELGVGSIVEGSVQVVDNRLRVNVQLIDAATDQHLWAERYDRTLDDAFAIQSEVAQRIVTAVGAALSSDEQGRISTAPTLVADAYRLYLEGLEYARRPGWLESNYERAEALFEQAVARDSSFALAHAALSVVHWQMYWFRYDASPLRAARQREEAEAALRLAPGLPQAHIAMGLVHYTGRDWQSALDQYAIALTGLPNDAEVLSRMGYAQRRLGHWEDVLATFEKLVRLSPRDANLYADLGGNTLRLLRRYADAVRAYDQALGLAPGLREVAVYRAWAFVGWRGELGPLRDALSLVVPNGVVGAAGDVAAERASLLLLQRDAVGLLGMPEARNGTVFEGQTTYMPAMLYAAWAHELRRESAAARAAYDAALSRLDGASRALPDDWRVRASRGHALAGLGRRDEALREARWLRDCEACRGDAYDREPAEHRAMILARAGECGEALAEIERLLAQPSRLSVPLFRLDPRWDPIRAGPRFQALLKKYEQ
jgi:TolB-like protein/tRNA A-37 threonylcarbamoyl transferase component Bud32/Flp pilus assembly protein TadD